MVKLSKRYSKPRWNYLSRDQWGDLEIEGHSVWDLSKKYGTPLYVLVEKVIRENLRRFKRAFPYQNLRPQYACKNNTNLEILRIVKEEGFEIDASSTGEIILALLAGFEPHQITFTNLYKTGQDINFAAKVGVQAVTADSIEEISRIALIGEKLKTKIRLFLRINPLIKMKGGYSTKNQHYGIPWQQAIQAIEKTKKKRYIQLIGFHFHGGYIPSPRVYHLAAKKLLELVVYCRDKKINITHIDLGGGFPVQHHDEDIFTPESMGKKFVKSFKSLLQKHDLLPPTLIFEPGKFITSNAGVGLIKIVSHKQIGKKKMLVTDGSTYAFVPDPIIYGCDYEILPATNMKGRRTTKYKITGCTCDSIDVIGKNVLLPTMEVDDLLAIMDCGAYSNVMASNFNTLKRAPMIMIKENGSVKSIRRRDRYSEMFAPELDVLKIADPNQLKNFYNLSRTNIDRVWRDYAYKKKRK